MSTALQHRSGTRQSRLDALNGELKLLRRQLERCQRLAAMGTMAAMVAHEFNNILTPVLNYARLARGGDPAMQVKAVERAFEAATRATAICRSLLGMTDADDEQPREVPLAGLVQETLTAMARDLDKDRIRLICTVRPEITVTARPAELKQVLLNLLLNARWALLGQAGLRRLSISAGRAGGSVRVQVADTGVGIPAENLPRIFEPFFTTRGRDSGTGLGLAVCRRLVESAGGRILVRSQVGKGSVFTVVLPAGAGGAPADPADEPSTTTRT